MKKNTKTAKHKVKHARTTSSGKSGTKVRSFPRQMILSALAVLVLGVCGIVLINNDAQKKSEQLALREPLNPYQVQSAAVSLPILGYWTLESIKYTDESIQTPNTTGKYTVDFANNGFLQIGADCVKAIGSYSTDGNSIDLSATISGENTCTEGSLGTRFIDALNKAEWYTFREGALVINMRSGAGTIVLVKVQ
ncbi:MAG: META domain-containing protein [Patescibacteria group bacterium]|nr:META domain-containing protein [Patescibacteria group bacterium]